ncbi:MAG: solute carrier family (sodium/hydrogen exchanger), er 1/2 [Clostridiales bacterium]|nr:solute carrier family (sodium/hydrogen exchanger), er 1/2 [Clostridiales bacterium]
MLLSLSLIIIVGFSLRGIFQKLRLPGLLGMLIAGILLGPHIFNLISQDILDISSDLREIALIVILIRAGLALDLKDLRRVGRPALLMCFVPALFEIAAVVLLAPPLLGISYLEAAILGTILGAVSPAVIVPKMLQLMEQGYGRKNSIPQLILAGASVDDIFNIILFTAFMGVYAGDDFSPAVLLKVPVSIITGLGAGIIIGFLMVEVFKKLHIRDTVKVLIILGSSFLIVALGDYIDQVVPFSGLLAVMAIGGTVLKRYEILARRISGKFGKIWVAAELILFVLLGAAVDVRYALGAGLAVAALILLALVVRAVGVLLSVSKTRLSGRERVFCVIAYTPKATVQAAIGALPLAAGVAAGNMILTTAVVSIMICAPLGAIAIEATYKKLLEN